MTRLSNFFKMLSIGLTSMYLLQVLSCAPPPLTNTGFGISYIPNIRLSIGNLMAYIQQIAAGT